MHRIRPLALFPALIVAETEAQTVFWEHKAKGQTVFICGESPVLASDNQNWNQSRITATDPCGLTGTFNRDESNWSTATAPDSPSVNVALNGSTPVTFLGNAVDVSTLTIADTNELRIRSLGNLRVFGGMIQNDGVLSLDDNGASVARLEINADTVLSGTGVLRFDSDDDNIISSSDPAFTLTVGPDQTLRTATNTTGPLSFDGSRITAALANQGLITADTGFLTFDTHPKSNSSTIEAINDATIVLRGVALDNTGGVLAAKSAGATFNLLGASVTGGALHGPGQYTIVSNQGATFNGPLTIREDASVLVDGFDKLSLTGTITNEGMVRLLGDAGNPAQLEIDGDVTLAGSGQIIFEADRAAQIASAAPEDVLTIGPTQLITTTAATTLANSRIVAAITNNGTITANIGDLELDTHPKTNNSVIEAIGGAEIRFNTVTVENAGGVIRADASSGIQLRNATIRGGRLEGPGGYSIPDNFTEAALEGLTITADTTITVDGFNTLSLGDTITNEGTIRLLGDSGNPAQLKIEGDVTLAGSGQILFDGAVAARLISAAPEDVLTISPGQTITTTGITTVANSRVLTAITNNGTVSADGGSLRLDTNPKTNNGTFRASNGGTLDVSSANTLLTNFDAGTGALTGGRYEAVGTGSTIILQNANVTEIGTGTEVVISGAGATIPALESLETLNGSLALRDGGTLSVGQSLAVNGRIEIGLPDGGTGGFGATSLSVDGDLDLTGATLDISDFGATDGSYQVFTATGSVTGAPTLGNIPPHLGTSVSIVGGTVTVTVFTAPEIVGIERDALTGAVTIRYESISGESFKVEGGTDLDALGDIRPDTALGIGGIMDYTDTPPASEASYFYRFVREP